VAGVGRYSIFKMPRQYLKQIDPVGFFERRRAKKNDIGSPSNIRVFLKGASWRVASPTPFLIP